MWVLANEDKENLFIAFINVCKNFVSLSWKKDYQVVNVLAIEVEFVQFVIVKILPQNKNFCIQMSFIYKANRCEKIQHLLRYE